MPQKQAVQDRWPINYPAVAKRSVTPPGEGIRAGWLVVRVGDEVKCISSIERNSTGDERVQIQYPKNDDGTSGRHGWTSVEALNIGKKEGPIIGDELSIEIGPSRYLDFHSDTLNSIVVNQGLLHATVLGLLTTWNENLDGFPKPPEYLRNNHTNTAQRRQNMALVQQFTCGSRVC